MKNWERFEDDIKKYGVGNIAVINGAPADCRNITDCRSCQFLSMKGCDTKITEWLYEETNK